MRRFESVPPAAGAVVMGTGIVSLALFHDSQLALSRVLLVAAAGGWIALGLLLGHRALTNPARVRREAASPTAMTGVAATAVLGARLNLFGWTWAGALLLAVALALWLALLAPVFAQLAPPTTGASLLLPVSTESLAVLGASVAAHDRAAWLLYVSLVPFCLGLAFYAFLIARFDLRQLFVGRGDHWITGGALAISALGAGRIALAARALHHLSGAQPALQVIAAVLWALTIAWLPVLVASEVLRPRLSYDLGRWSTVFPVGMYASCSFIVGAAAHTPGITDFARGWVWVALAVWLATAAATILHSPRKLFSPRTS